MGNQFFKDFYFNYVKKVDAARQSIGRSLTLAEKILFSHLDNTSTYSFKRGEDYVLFRPDRVAMQDATAQMALLQFMSAGRPRVAVPSSIHADHLIIAKEGANEDLIKANETNKEVYDFLKSVANKYGIDFWPAGAGIIHQVVLENYAFPAGMMIGTDSHTPNAGGLTMAAVGVGGADACDVMSGMPWELKMPKILGVHLKGSLKGWASAKDVILNLLGMLTVKGGTNYVIEYFGSGVHTLSATEKATICNMGAELGATTSIFPTDSHSIEYLKATDRTELAETVSAILPYLRADDEVVLNPAEYYDRVIEIDLDILKPFINGPFTPDLARTVADMKTDVKSKDYEDKVDTVLIGSCTNSSYNDLCKAAMLLKFGLDNDIELKSNLIINPGSILVYETCLKEGIIDIFLKAGALIMANACGPCIGQWQRKYNNCESACDAKNSIITTFNRNFAKRADGNPNTYAFITSPDMAIAYALSGRLSFNPYIDTVKNKAGKDIKLEAPQYDFLPKNGFVKCDRGMIAPLTDGSSAEVKVSPTSERLQLLTPFAAWNGNDFMDIPLLIKTKGKCTTDHISMAGPWLKYRGHLENISANLLMGATNFFNDKTNEVKNIENGKIMSVSESAKHYKDMGLGSIVIAEDNYGEGSSREQAAMEPRFLDVKAIITKSFARIHETNLKKQGVLALTFKNPADYDKILEDDRISIVGLSSFAPNKLLKAIIKHSDGTNEEIEISHTYNSEQIEWFKKGSALNCMKERL